MSLKRTFCNLIPAISVCLFTLACSSERTKPIGLYDIDSLVEEQTKYLHSHRAVLTKTAQLNESEKISSLTPKTIQEWENELAIFSELNAINKPTNKGAYKIENYPDTRSNLMIKSFSTTEELPVRFLKLYYQRSVDRIYKLEAQYNETNSLFSSGRFLAMEFDEHSGQSILTSYEIKGGQKMVMDDSVQYEVKVAVKTN
jgi:hypothetical protein